MPSLSSTVIAALTIAGTEAPTTARIAPANLARPPRRGCAERGWPIYRIHPVFQQLGMEMFGFGGGALHRLHETLKDAIDPNGIVAPGRYDIWPRRLRGTRA